MQRLMIGTACLALVGIAASAALADSDAAPPALFAAAAWLGAGALAVCLQPLGGARPAGRPSRRSPYPAPRRGWAPGAAAAAPGPAALQVRWVHANGEVTGLRAELLPPGARPGAGCRVLAHAGEATHACAGRSPAVSSQREDPKNEQ